MKLLRHRHQAANANWHGIRAEEGVAGDAQGLDQVDRAVALAAEIAHAHAAQFEQAMVIEDSIRGEHAILKAGDGRH
jgi:hypothetical protein